MACLAVVMSGSWIKREQLFRLLHELRTKFRLGGPIGDYIGCWGRPIKGYTTNLVQGSHQTLMFFRKVVSSFTCFLFTPACALR